MIQLSLVFTIRLRPKALDNDVERRLALAVIIKCQSRHEAKQPHETRPPAFIDFTRQHHHCECAQCCNNA